MKNTITAGAFGASTVPLKSSGISRDEWLKAMQDAQIESSEDDQGAMTRTEFAALFGYSDGTAARRLGALVKAGKARETSKRAQDAIGRSVLLRAYRLL